MTIWALAAFIIVTLWGAVGWLLWISVERQRQSERGYYYQALGNALVENWNAGEGKLKDEAEGEAAER